jgi:hypothetical protein
MTMQTETFELPTHWATSLLYGDNSAVDDDQDTQALDAFIDWMLAKYGQCWAIDVADDHAFARWHDATCFGVFPCDVSTYTFDVTPQEKRP